MDKKRYVGGGCGELAVDDAESLVESLRGNLLTIGAFDRIRFCDTAFDVLWREFVFEHETSKSSASAIMPVLKRGLRLNVLRKEFFNQRGQGPMLSAGHLLSCSL